MDCCWLPLPLLHINTWSSLADYKCLFSETHWWQNQRKGKGRNILGDTKIMLGDVSDWSMTRVIKHYSRTDCQGDHKMICSKRVWGYAALLWGLDSMWVDSTQTCISLSHFLPRKCHHVTDFQSIVSQLTTDGSFVILVSLKWANWGWATHTAAQGKERPWRPMTIWLQHTKQFSSLNLNQQHRITL